MSKLRDIATRLHQAGQVADVDKYIERYVARFGACSWCEMDGVIHSIGDREVVCDCQKRRSNKPLTQR